MNALPGMCVAALLAVLPAMALAQQAPPEAAEPEKAEREQVKKEVGEAVDAIREYSVERRTDAVANARRSAEDIDRRIAVLQTQLDQRWSRMSESARSRSQRSMAELRQRRNDMAEWYGGMRHGSAEAWAEVKAGFIESYRDMAEAIRKAQAEFDQEPQAPAEPPAPPADDRRR